MSMWIFWISIFAIIVFYTVMFFQIRKSKKEILELQIKALTELGKIIKQGRESKGWTEEKEEQVKKEGIDIIVKASGSKK